MIQDTTPDSIQGKVVYNSIHDGGIKSIKNEEEIINSNKIEIDVATSINHMEHSIKSIELNWIQLQMKNWNKKDCSNFFIKRTQRQLKNARPKKNSKKFVWENEHEEAFKSIIKFLTDTNSSALGHFDPDTQTISITDASRVGFGMALLLWDKENLNCLRSLQCHSQMVSDLETR